MKLREAFETYNFENAGQFSGIAQSLGYETEYRDGHFRFRKGDENIVMGVKEIRARASMIDDEPGREASKERVAAFFDKDRANDPAYLKELEKEGVSIIRWENLKGEERDGFTIIDHKNKVSYTGQALYEYAQQQGNILDGKGTRLEKGVMSDLMDLNGRPGKLRFNADGISVFYRKESLVIPDKILGKKLSKKDKEQLLAGEVVPVRIRDKDIFLQVDRDLNSVIVRSNQELKIPQVIGKTDEYEGYKLTKSDKYLLANGHSLENKLLHSKDGYFIADIQLTEDRKGVMIQKIVIKRHLLAVESFSNIFNITSMAVHLLLRVTKERKTLSCTFSKMTLIIRDIEVLGFIHNEIINLVFCLLEHSSRWDELVGISISDIKRRVWLHLMEPTASSTKGIVEL